MKGLTRFAHVACAAALLFVLQACGPGMQTMYVEDTTRSDVQAFRFSHKDMSIMAKTMVDDLVASNVFEDRPLVRVSRVKNKTSDHIDTKSLTDSIRTHLIKSRKVKFVTDISETEARKELVNELKFGESALADTDSAPELGKLKAAKFHLYGEIVSSATSDGRVKERFTKLTLSMVDVETGVIEWTNEKAILKQGKKSLLGW